MQRAICKWRYTSKKKGGSPYLFASFHHQQSLTLSHFKVAVTCNQLSFSCMPGKADHENRTTKISTHSRNRPDKVDSTVLSLEMFPYSTSQLVLSSYS